MTIQEFYDWALENDKWSTNLCEVLCQMEQPPFIATLNEIKSEIENYKLSEDEISEMDEDSVKWGMAIVIGIIDKYIHER